MESCKEVELTDDQCPCVSPKSIRVYPVYDRAIGQSCEFGVGCLEAERRGRCRLGSRCTC